MIQKDYVSPRNNKKNKIKLKKPKAQAENQRQVRHVCYCISKRNAKGKTQGMKTTTTARTSLVQLLHNYPDPKTDEQ